MYSHATIMGCLTRDPEQKKIGDKIVCNFTVAANNSKNDTCFMDVEVWDKRAEFVMQYFKKGKPIIVSGPIRQHTWEKDGQKRSKHSIAADKVSFVQMPRDEAQVIEQPAQYPEAVASIKADIKEIYGSRPITDDLPF